MSQYASVRMEKLWSLKKIFLLVTLGVSLSSANAGNLVINGRLEGKGKLPDKWMAPPERNLNTVFTPGAGPGGCGVWTFSSTNKPMKFDARVLRIPIRKGGRYIFSCKVKTKDFSGSHLIGFINRKWTASFSLRLPRNTKGWQTVSRPFTAFDSLGNCMLILYSPGAEGSLSVCDFKLVPSPEYAWQERLEKRMATVREKQLFLKKDPRFAKKTVLVTPIGITSDFSVPFLPEEVLTPVKKITLRAAVNEIKPLALAVTNNTDRLQEYRVVIEAGPVNQMSRRFREGLVNFPRVTMRQGVTVSETEAANNMLIDPLPEMNQARTVTIRPRQSALVWADFDTTGMKPGVYRGRVLAVPLEEPGVFGPFRLDRTYKGNALAVPVEFTVSPIHLPKDPVKNVWLYSSLPARDVVQKFNETGCRWYNLSIWYYLHTLNEKGDLVLKAPQASEAIRRYRKLAKEQGFEARFCIFYSAWEFSLRMHKGNKKHFQQWVKQVGEFMRKEGLKDDQWFIELQDEPWSHELPKVLEYARAAKEAAPHVRLCLTITSSRIKDPGLLKPFIPLTDVWTFHRTDWKRSKKWQQFADSLARSSKHNSIYTCETEMFSPLHQNYRTLPWFAECKNFPSVSLYQGIYSSYNQSQYDFKRPQEGTVFYRSFTETIPSLRSMAFRQGMTDIKYLAVLKKLAPKHPEAAKFLKAAAKRVVINHLNDPAMPDKVREEAAALILKLKGSSK